MARAFLSYVRDDQAQIDRLCQELRAQNVDVWLDRDSIEPGQRWQPAIRRAIEDGAFFLAHKAHYVLQTAKWSRALAQSRNSTTV